MLLENIFAASFVVMMLALTVENIMSWLQISIRIQNAANRVLLISMAVTIITAIWWIWRAWA